MGQEGKAPCIHPQRPKAPPHLSLAATTTSFLLLTFPGSGKPTPAPTLAVLLALEGVAALRVTHSSCLLLKPDKQPP